MVSDKALKDFRGLPQDLRELIVEDMNTAFENRVKAMKRIHEKRMKAKREALKRA